MDHERICHYFNPSFRGSYPMVVYTYSGEVGQWCGTSPTTEDCYCVAEGEVRLVEDR
jgi:hypothetical protein